MCIVSVRGSQILNHIQMVDWLGSLQGYGDFADKKVHKKDITTLKVKSVNQSVGLSCVVFTFLLQVFPTNNENMIRRLYFSTWESAKSINESFFRLNLG